MADDRIRVKLTPQRAAPTAGSKDKKPMLVGVSVSFTRKGKGRTLATASPQPATLTFFEMPEKKDTNQTPRQFATLQGAIRLDGAAPVFDVKFNAISYAAFVRGPRPSAPAPDFSSDFRLALDLQSPHFENPLDTQTENNSLVLPWEFEGENGKLEIDVELKIAGQLEAPLGSNAPLDVPLAHPQVLDDGANPPARTYFGVGTVYAITNEIFERFKLKGQLKMPSQPITINLHKSIDRRATSIATVAQKIQEIFADAQITATVVASRSDADALGAGFRPRTFAQGRAFMTTKCANLDVPLVGEGTTLPFFEYWAFLESALNTLSNESALSEAVQAVSQKATTKLVLSPIHLLVGSVDGNDRPLERNLGLVNDKDTLIANVVATRSGIAWAWYTACS